MTDEELDEALRNMDPLERTKWGAEILAEMMGKNELANPLESRILYRQRLRKMMKEYLEEHGTHSSARGDERD